MPTLRLTQYAESQPNRYRVEIALEGDGPRQTAQVSFDYQLSEQDRENIRWYLEDYLQYPHDPAPQIAARVERRMFTIGIELFQAVFQVSDGVRDLWATLRHNLNNTRIEILTAVDQAAAIPWELIRDPRTDTPLALRAPAFVRVHSQAAQRPKLPQTNGETIRILLVICRPRGRFDVPFRSVASRILKGLGTQPDSFQLDVLRPPTFETLSRKLRQAKAEGTPYHVLHFDGHGVYQDSQQVTLQSNPLIFRDARPGMHGYLAFENSANEDNVEFINGPELGRLLVETDVPVLVLNACRSAHTDAQNTPTQMAIDKGRADDPHAQIRAFGSLAQEVIDAGVAGVVAMRYNVYVMTAAQFVNDLYTALVQGQTLGEAVSLGRKQLDAQPQREIASRPISLQDWLVPIVYEAAPIALFSKPTKSVELKITLHSNDAFPVFGWIDPQLPRTPDAGFFGRDETLLAIDRAFDQHSIVLIHAFAGSGKTSTAAEFGRWYSLTGGIQGPVLFTSFERYLPLPRVLDKLGQFFQQELEQSGIHWSILEDEQRRKVAIQLLYQIPVLWIWDNVGSTSGLSDSENHKSSIAERQKLSNFLRDATQTRAKFLLITRRRNQHWIESFSVRISVPPMRMPDRVQLTKALLQKYGRGLESLQNWNLLLEYTQGNPDAIQCLVKYVVDGGYATKEKIENVVEELKSHNLEVKSGNANKYITKNFSYFFDHSLNESERNIVALLHFFQGYVSIWAFEWMRGSPNVSWYNPSVYALSHDEIVDLLSKIEEAGFLSAINNEYYRIHPLFEIFLRHAYRFIYEGESEEDYKRKLYAFVRATGMWGQELLGQFDNGNNNAIVGLEYETSNLWYAVKTSRTNFWKDGCFITMPCLRRLYHSTGRKSEWNSTVENIIADFIDLEATKALKGFEEVRNLAIDYLVDIEIEKQNWAIAEKYQKTVVDEARIHKNNLGCALNNLGQIQKALEKSDCINTYRKAYENFIRDKELGNTAAAAAAWNIGRAYIEIGDNNDLSEAEYWFRRSYELHPESHGLGRSRCLIELGRIASSRLHSVLMKNQLPLNDIKQKHLLLGHPSRSEADCLLKEALDKYLTALQLIPEYAVTERASVNNEIAYVYSNVCDFEESIKYYQKSIALYEEIDDMEKVAQTQIFLSRAFSLSYQFDKAIVYSDTALLTANKNSLGEIAKLAREVQELIKISASESKNK